MTHPTRPPFSQLCMCQHNIPFAPSCSSPHIMTLHLLTQSVAFRELSTQTSRPTRPLLHVGQRYHAAADGARLYVMLSTADIYRWLDGSEFMGERLVVQFARGNQPRPRDGYHDAPRMAPRPRRTVHRMTITGLPFETSWQVSILPFRGSQLLGSIISSNFTFSAPRPPSLACHLSTEAFVVLTAATSAMALCFRSHPHMDIGFHCRSHILRMAGLTLVYRISKTSHVNRDLM